MKSERFLSFPTFNYGAPYRKWSSQSQMHRMHPDASDASKIRVLNNTNPMSRHVLLPCSDSDSGFFVFDFRRRSLWEVSKSEWSTSLLSTYSGENKSHFRQISVLPIFIFADRFFWPTLISLSFCQSHHCNACGIPEYQYPSTHNIYSNFSTFFYLQSDARWRVGVHICCAKW